eukprot:446618_1
MLSTQFEENQNDAIESNYPIIVDINWTDNGKLLFSFKYCPLYGYSIHLFELYYCYINENNKDWFKYASNNWLSITIPSTTPINNNIELRIGTHNDLYDEHKKKHIELVMKLRCELKGRDFQHHLFYTEFSEIYFVKSITIPSILNNQTNIEQILKTIFTSQIKQTQNQNPQTVAMSQLASLYQAYNNTSGIKNVFTKLLKKYITNYYENKYN